MKFERKDLYYTIIILILLFFSIIGFNKLNNVSEQYKNLENTIAAMNDTIQVINNKDGSTTFQQLSPEIYLKDLINSEYFKTLSADQQEFYTQLNSIKRLISATKAELQKQGEVLASIGYAQNPGTVNPQTDSISFKLGTDLAFSETDTSKNLQWTANVVLDSTISFKYNYDYKFNLLTTFERQKDKSVLVKYKIDDPELKVNDMKNFIIPPEQRNTAIGRWYDKNKRTLNIIGGVAVFSAGGYLGYTLAK